MKFIETPLQGLYVVERRVIADERGFFARVYCKEAFAQAGIDFEPVQANLSGNKSAGTIRGMHLQNAPHAEAKLVSCAAGRIYDVAVDVRPKSPTYLRWFGIELDAKAKSMLFVPGGFAHGYLTLTDDAETSYLVDQFYHPESGHGYQPDDPAIGIDWPSPIKVISEQDRTWPLLKPSS